MKLKAPRAEHVPRVVRRCILRLHRTSINKVLMSLNLISETIHASDANVQWRIQTKTWAKRVVATNSRFEKNLWKKLLFLSSQIKHVEWMHLSLSLSLFIQKKLHGYPIRVMNATANEIWNDRVLKKIPSNAPSHKRVISSKLSAVHRQWTQITFPNWWKSKYSVAETV